MARLRSSKVFDLPTSSQAATDVQSLSQERRIGEILAEKLRLDEEQVALIARTADERRMRFGDAAVALGLATSEQVLGALAEQFHYPYASQDEQSISEELVALRQPFVAQSEAIRSIRSQLMMRVFNEGGQNRAVAIVSPASGDGKSFFAANLAVTLAQQGGRTLLVDADLRGPRQHEIFRVEGSAGLSSLLAGRTDSQVIQQVPSVNGLFLLPVGVVPPNPLELLERQTFSLLMHELTSRFDHVVVDTPAAVYGADAHVIADRCGAAVIVARKDASRLDALKSLANALTESQAEVVGVIMNEY